jgi:hypothetical protein
MMSSVVLLVWVGCILMGYLGNSGRGIMRLIGHWRWSGNLQTNRNKKMLKLSHAYSEKMFKIK